MRWIGQAVQAIAGAPKDLCRSLAGAIGGLALGFITQTTLAQQTLQQQQNPGVIVQHPQAPPKVTTQPEQGTTTRQQQEPLQPSVTVPPAGVQESVDTTGIWYRLRLHDLKNARAEFTRLSHAHPQWKPPADLIFALRSAEFAAAKAQHNTDAMRRLATSIGSFDRCAHPDVAWSIAQSPGIGDRHTLLDMAQHCGNPGIAAGSMDRYLRGLPPPSQLATATSLAQQQWPQSVRQVLDGVRLQTSLAALAAGHPTDTELADAEAIAASTRNAGAAIAIGWYYLNGGKATKAVQWFSNAVSWGGGTSAQEGLDRSLQAARGAAVASKTPPPKAPPAAAPIRAAQAPATPPADVWLARALNAVDRGAPMSEIAANVQRAVELGRRDAWESVGWRLLDHHRPEDALTAFTQASPTENATFGRVLAARAAGHDAETSAVACGHRSLSQRLTEACADVLANQQLAAYRAGDYAEAEKLGDQLAEIAPNRSGVRVLTAWSAYHTGDPKKAADIFAALYDQNHTPDLAQGLALSLRASGQPQLLAHRVADGDTILGNIVAAENADTAWYRKQFDLAATGPSPNPSLSGQPGWLVGTGMETALISGAPGQDRFNALAGRIFAEGMSGPVRIGVSLTGAGIDIGTPPQDALIGLRPGPDQVTPTTGAGIIQPELSLSWETPGWTTSTGLGLTPLNAPVSPLPTASLSVTHYMDRVILSGRVFAESVTNSLLSYGGMHDPVTGAAWGRVMDIGGSLQAIYLPADRVSVSFTGEGAHLIGDDVVSNNRLSLRLDVAYDFRPQGLDHLRVGPFVSFAHYERNLDFFTFGQGGYYSPDSDTREGILIDLLTAEGRRWQVEAKQSLAYGNVSEAASPEYPLSNSSPTFPGTRFSGVDADTQLRGSVLLSDHLILSGFMGYSNAPGYKGWVTGVFLSVPFDARRGVFSVDLPDSTFRPFNVWR
jgi:tetratricopeptide (TPR) repeat protein